MELIEDKVDLKKPGNKGGAGSCSVM